MYDFANESRDSIIMSMVTNEGMSLNKATKEYVRLKKAAGLAVGVVSHRDDAMELLSTQAWDGLVDPKPLVELLTSEFKVKADTAMNYIKMYAEENGHEVRSRMASEDILAYIVDRAPEGNADADWDNFILEFKAWMSDQGKSNSNTNEYIKGIRLHRMLVAR